ARRLGPGHAQPPDRLDVVGRRDPHRGGLGHGPALARPPGPAGLSERVSSIRPGRRAAPRPRRTAPPRAPACPPDLPSRAPPPAGSAGPATPPSAAGGR